MTGQIGRRNLLVAGGSASTLIGGESEDRLIGGTTIYDPDPTLANWLAIADYWAGTDDFATRAAYLPSDNGVPLLDASTVTGNGGMALIYSDGQGSIQNGFAAISLVSIAPGYPNPLMVSGTRRFGQALGSPPNACPKRR